MNGSDAETNKDICALVIGPGGVADGVIHQLQKNARFRIVWAGKDLEDSQFFPEFGEEIAQFVDLDKTVSPMNINNLIDEYEPDIVFWCQRGAEWDSGDSVAGVDLEREILGEAIIVGNAPVITVSLEQEQPHGPMQE